MAEATTGEGFKFKDGSIPGVCKICGEPAWSARSNRCEIHKIEAKKSTGAKRGVGKRGPGKNNKGSSPRITSDGSPEATVVAQVVESVGSISTKTFSSRPPTAAEWDDKLGDLVVLLTMVYVEYAVVRPFKLADDVAAHWIEQLGMTEQEAATIVEPCSFLIAKTDLNKKHGREAMEVLAFAPAILSVIEWTNRVSEFRREMQRQLGGENVVSFESPRPAESSIRVTESGAPIANFGGDTDPDNAPTKRVDRSGADVEQQN